MAEHEGDGNTNSNLGIWNGPQSLEKETGRVGNRKKNRNHSYNGIVKIGPNSQNSPGYQKRLGVTQTPVKDYQQTLAWKTPRA